jgi:hypothetical protein
VLALVGDLLALVARLNAEELAGVVSKVISVLYSWLGEDIGDDDKAQIFQLTLTATQLCDRDESTRLLRANISSFPRWLDSPTSGNSAVLALEALRNASADTNTIFESAIDQLCAAILRFTEINKQHFYNHTEWPVMKTVQRLVRFLEQVQPNIVFDRGLARLKSETPDAGLIVLRRVMSSTRAGNVVQPLTELLPKKLSPETRFFVFRVWAAICRYGADVSTLTIPVFQAILPLKEKVADLQKELARIAIRATIQNLADVAAENRFIPVLPVAAGALAAASGELVHHTSVNSLRPRVIFFAACQHFDAVTRANLIGFLAKLFEVVDANEIGDRLREKNCPYCANRGFHRLFAQLSDRPYAVLAEAFTFGDSLVTENRLSPSEVRAAQVLIAAERFAGAPPSEQFAQTWNPLASKLDPTVPGEAVAFATALQIVQEYNAGWAAEQYKAKGEARKYRQTSALFQLEFCSRALSQNRSFTQKVSDLLTNESLPPRAIAHAQRRFIRADGAGGALLDKFLTSDDAAIVKPALSSFLKLAKSHRLSDSSLAPCLKQVLLATKKFESGAIRALAKEIYKVTPLGVNGAHLLADVFTGPARVFEGVDLLLELVQTLPPAPLKTPATAAATALLLLSPPLSDRAQVLARAVFAYVRSPSDFPLTYLLSSNPDEASRFVAELVRLLASPAPWGGLAEGILADLAQDSRFPAHTARAMDAFVDVAATAGASVARIARLLLAIDRFQLLGKLLAKANDCHIQLFCELISETAQTVLDIAFRAQGDAAVYKTVLAIIATAPLPQEQQLSAFVFVVFVLAQFSDLAEAGQRALAKLDRFPEVRSARVSRLFEEFEGRTKDYGFLFGLFGLVAGELSLYHIAPFTPGVATGALAGYAQMVPQGRPLLNEMLPLFRDAPAAALRAIPALPRLTPENYGEIHLAPMLDFVLERAPVDDEAFACVAALFSWLPRDLWNTRAQALFDATLRALRRETPPTAAFACVSKCAEALFFANRRDFGDVLPHFTALALARAADPNRELADAARAALVACVSAAGMHETAQAVRGAVAAEDFIAEVAGPFTAEMRERVADAVFAAAQSVAVEARIAIARVLAVAVQKKRHTAAGVHLKLAGMLSDADARVKIAVLAAIRENPPSLA